jgi:CO/xanthine dehydrogenase FAD-binding subunit
VEAAVHTGESADALVRAAAAEVDADSEYRRHVAARLVARAVSEARDLR